MALTDSTDAVAMASRSSLAKTGDQNEGPAALPSQAETTLNAILDLLERNQNKRRATQSRTPASQESSFDSTLSVDRNLQTLHELEAIAQSYQIGKEQIPRSGIADEDIDLSNYEVSGPVPEIQRVGVARLLDCQSMLTFQ